MKLVLYSYDFKLDPGSYDFKVMIIILENNGCEVNITEKMYTASGKQSNSSH